MSEHGQGETARRWMYVRFWSTRKGYKEGPLLGPFLKLVMRDDTLRDEFGEAVAEYLVRDWKLRKGAGASCGQSYDHFTILGVD